MKKITYFYALLFAMLIGGGWTNYVWGATTANLTIVPVFQEADENEVFGYIYAEYKTSVNPAPTQDNVTESQWKSTSYTATKSQTSALSGKYFHCYAKVGGDNYAFEGWYTDPGCNTAAPNAWNDNTKEYGVYTSANYAYKFSVTKNETGNFTLYAKFVKGSTTNKFQSQLTVQTESTEKGVIDVSKTGVDSWGMIVFDEASLDDDTRGKDSKTIKGDQEETEETSTSQIYYVYAQPLRGYQFAEWTPGDGVTLEDTGDEWMTYYATSNSSAYNVSVSTDNTKTADGVYGYTGTLTATFSTLDADASVTIQKDANKGSVAVSYANWEYDSSSKVARKKSHALDAMSSSETEKTYSSLYYTDEITLTATPATGYDFEGWYYWDEYSSEWQSAGTERTYTTSIYGNTIYEARFNVNRERLNPTEEDKFIVGFSLCQTFEQALAVASSSDQKTILQLQNYTVPAGNYTIPAGVKLIIPHSEEQKGEEPTISREQNGSLPTTPYRTLTLSDGVKLDVYGTIEVGGTQYVGGEVVKTTIDGVEYDFRNGTGRPGVYCQLVMNGSSSITLNNGALLRAWGYVTGSGTIDARRGAEVREQFQVMDWKGGSNAKSMVEAAATYKVFPINQYFIQNVEVATKYRPGARLFTTMGIFLPAYGFTAGADDVQIIGVSDRADGSADDVAMFLMDDTDDSEDSWVRKSYDVTNDKQIYDVNNSAHLGGITIYIAMAQVSMDSRGFDLPITSNMKIHLLNGNMDITQNTVLLPGAEIEIDKKSTVTINAGQSIYLYDTKQWDKYAHSGVYAKQVPFRPGGVSSRDVSTAAALGDAAINVHGTFDVKGAIYTTAGGANIYSSVADAGTVYFTAAAGADAQVYQWKNSGTKYFAAACTSAQLTNGNASFTQTTEATAGQSFCYIDFDGDGKGEWKSLTVVDDIFVKDEKEVYYIKPGAYVPIKKGSKPEVQDDHTYHDEYNDSGRMFILATGNQWWEVTKVGDNLFKCEHPNNTTYYYYDEHDEEWLEKKFKVTWLNWDGSPVTYKNDKGNMVNYYYVTYNTVPDWKGSTPTHADDDSHTYSFSGWLPAPAPVTEDVTYVAQFAERDRMYAITFNDANNELIQLVYCKLGEVPVCTKHTLTDTEQWSPAVGAVAGNQTYKLAAKNNDGPFTITFVNWDGNVLQTLENVTSGTTLVPPANPTKDDDDLHSYTFDGWTPAVTPATADATYTAIYTTAPRSNDIVLDANGSQNLNDVATLKDNLIITSDGSSSGQLLGASKLTLKGEAVFKLATTIPARTWYAVAAPWKVDVRTGIYANGNRLTVGRDFDIIEFDAEAYASGDSGEKNRNIWKYVEENGGVMMPGKLYMVYLASEKSSLEFHRTTGSNVLTTAVPLSTTGGSDAKDNWNAIANPALYYADLNIEDGLQYKSYSGGYSAGSTANMIVGQPIFVQIKATSVISTIDAERHAAPAYRRAPQTATDNRFVVEITRDGQMNDRIIVQTAEEKADEYVIGKDLAKIGVGTKAAQMWMERYNTQLCKNTLEMKGEQVDYPLSLYAPAAGEYILTAAQERGEATLYLTRNDKPVWNLSYGEYVLNLEKGTTTEYGLRLVGSNAPQITTGIGNVQGGDAQCTKVLRDGVIYILRGEKVYTIDGQLVK